MLTISAYLFLSALPFLHAIGDILTYDSDWFPPFSGKDFVEVPLELSIRRDKRSAASSVAHYRLAFNALHHNFTSYLEPFSHSLIGSDTPIYVQYSQNNGVGYKSWTTPVETPHVIHYRDVEDGTTAVKYISPKGNAVFHGYTTLNNATYMWGFRIPHIGDHDLRNILIRVEEMPNYSGGSPYSRYTNVRSNYGGQASTYGDVAYPEILVVVDNGIYNALNKDVNAVVEYMTAFWTLVDLRYRPMTNPTVRLSIAGIIIGVDPWAIPYAADNLNVAFIQMKNYFNTNFKWERSYDAVMLIQYLASGRTTKRERGLASLGGICRHRGNIAISTDAANFNGVIKAAHELGHLLGATDEVTDKVSYHYRGEVCKAWNLVYIMGYYTQYDTENTVNNYFSQCSLEEMSSFLRSGAANCVYNKPNVGKPKSKVLSTLTLDGQCQRDFGPKWKSGNSGNEACQLLKCCKESSYIHFGHKTCLPAFSPAAEGSICSADRVCLNGVCQMKPVELRNGRHIEFGE